MGNSQSFVNCIPSLPVRQKEASPSCAPKAHDPLGEQASSRKCSHKPLWKCTFVKLSSFAPLSVPATSQRVSSWPFEFWLEGQGGIQGDIWASVLQAEGHTSKALAENRRGVLWEQEESQREPRSIGDRVGKLAVDVNMFRC